MKGKFGFTRDRLIGWEQIDPTLYRGKCHDYKQKQKPGVSWLVCVPSRCKNQCKKNIMIALLHKE